MPIFTIIQARMGSSRLPGKVMMPIGRKPAIRHVYDRARFCRNTNKVIIATTNNLEDAELCEYCANNDIPCFRGNADDVLDRYYQAARHLGAKKGDYIVRVTGDCPFLDPAVCDEVIALAKTSGADYASNTIEETYPDGLDCEVFSVETLSRMHRDALFQFEREHVTQYAKRNPEKFKLQNLRCQQNLNRERWTLDEPEDYEFLCKVYDGIGREFFSMNDVLAYLEKNSGLREINGQIIRNEGLLRSLSENSGGKAYEKD